MHAGSHAAADLLVGSENEPRDLRGGKKAEACDGAHDVDVTGGEPQWGRLRWAIKEGTSPRC